MTAFLVEVTSTKFGVLNPNIVGPFTDTDAAEVFAAAWDMGEPDEIEGGYGAVHVIAAEFCQSPEDYAAERREYLDELAHENDLQSAGAERETT